MKTIDNHENLVISVGQVDMTSCKVHCVLEAAAASEDVTCCSLDRPSSKRESFTVWMKSLLMQGYGCTVFGESGEVLYRMDNYDTKQSREVYLMDLRGRVLFTILKRKLRVFGRWEGYNPGCPFSSPQTEKTWFRVRKDCSFLRKSFHCEVTIFFGKIETSGYSINGFIDKLEFNIKSSNGAVIAEVKRKQTISGVYLGEDVWSLVIEPQVDRPLIMALVAVYGSICNRM